MARLELGCSSIQLFFWGKVVRRSDNDVMSFHMHFERMGCELLREAFQSEGEFVVSLKRGGKIRKDHS